MHVHTAIKYNCSQQFVISIAIKLGKTLKEGANVCKIDQFVHPNTRFLYPSIWLYRFNRVTNNGMVAKYVK